MWFTPFGVDGTRFTAGAEIGVHNLGGFGARLYGNWNKFDFDDAYAVGDLPNYDAGLELSYGYKDIFSVSLGAELIGKREYLVRVNNPSLISSMASRPTVGSIEPVIDLTFSADAKIARDFWVFLKGENIADQKLYPYPHYSGLGASVLGGVKIVF